MEKYILALFFCGIIVGTVVSAKVNGLDSTILARVEEYDEKLSTFIQEILENFREQMRDGLPDIGIPPVDPFAISKVDEKIDNDFANLSLYMKDINITGFSKFEINYLKADLERGFANFSIFLPVLQTEGYCSMDGKIFQIFPIRSDGPFKINVTKVKIEAYGSLNISTYENKTRIHMDDLKLDLSFGTLNVEFESLLGGAKWTQILIKILTTVGKNMFVHFHEDAMTNLGSYLLTAINKHLDQGALVDLLDRIQLPAPEMFAKRFELQSRNNGSQFTVM